MSSITDEQVLAFLGPNCYFVDEVGLWLRVGVARALEKLEDMERRGLVYQMSGKRYAATLTRESWPKAMGEKVTE